MDEILTKDAVALCDNLKHRMVQVQAEINRLEDSGLDKEELDFQRGHLCGLRYALNMIELRCL